MDVREKIPSEKRLIDANAFLKDILTAGIGKTIIEYSESDIGYMIRKRHTVDAVEVVRCRDCKHMIMRSNMRYCAVWHGPNGMGDDGFCNYGERKDGDGNG